MRGRKEGWEEGRTRKEEDGEREGREGRRERNQEGKINIHIYIYIYSKMEQTLILAN